MAICTTAPVYTTVPACTTAPVYTAAPVYTTAACVHHSDDDDDEKEDGEKFDEEERRRRRRRDKGHIHAFCSQHPRCVMHAGTIVRRHRGVFWRCVAHCCSGVHRRCGLHGRCGARGRCGVHSAVVQIATYMLLLPVFPVPSPGAVMPDPHEGGAMREEEEEEEEDD